MFIIAGLGNPGRQYEHTRHNAGFDVIDAIAEKYHIRIGEKKHRALCGSGFIGGEKVVLAKPQTYMNVSGESIAELISYYKSDPEEELLVIYDDISLAPGSLRIRKKGSAGGHNGIKSIIACTQTQVFQRIKIGNDFPRGCQVDYVLGRFDTADRSLFEQAALDAVCAAEMILRGETDLAMNEFNRKVQQETDRTV